MLSDLPMTGAVSTKNAYLISGVPFYGVHNHFDRSLSVPVNSVASIMEYWEPGRSSSSDMQEVISKQQGGAMNEVVSFFSRRDFSAKVLKLPLTDLKKYINPEVKTPLLLFLPISVDQPAALAYAPSAVMIGLDEKEQKLTFHNYWLGNNYEMSFDEFNQLENKLRPDQRDMYIVVQPKDLDEKLKGISGRKTENYPARTEIMRNGEQMFKDYAVGSGGAYESKMFDVALDFLSRVEKSPNFNEFFPPYMKTMLYSKMASAYIGENNFDSALVYAQKAAAIDQDLDQPFKDWSGMKINWRAGSQSQLSDPYSLLGDIYRQQKDFQKAEENYVKALSIAPSSATAKNGMEIINALKK
ncbi:MAG: tetratricopeptide repeat protein [Parcubacteria group bacterium]